MTAAKKLVDDKLLKTLVPFGELKEEQFAKLSGQYKVETFKAGQTLFTQGEHDNRTYFLLAGQVNLRYGDGSVKSIVSDTPQAQYALVPVRPRQATATSKTPITVLSMDANLFDDILSWGNENGFHVSELDTHDDQNDWMTCFLQSKVFLRLPAQNIQALMMRLEEVHVKAGQVVIRQGDDDGYYYIIKSGRCRVSRKHSPKDKELELAMLTVGEGFGEEAIITHNRRGASVTMLEHGCLMRLSRNDFNRLLVEPLITMVSHGEVANDPRSVFLDVRNYQDYARNGITGSKNITLTELRLKIDQFDSSKQYIVCSNTGSRAAAAAFLLCQQGIDAAVLRFGLENLPADVKRGNGVIEDADHIPVVDNVVKLNKEAAVEKLPELPAKRKEPPRPVTTDEAMKDPRVKALFSQAQQRVQAENDRAKQADSARIQAQREVNRLKNEADQARRQMEEAKHQAEKAAKDSAMAARLEAKREAARLRELELGAKQAELEEAVRQAEEQAQRTQDASKALQHAEQEIDNLKKEMQLAVERAQEEAHKSAETIREFLEQEAKRQKQESERIAEQEAQRARQAEQAHLKAQQEIERLKADAEATRDRLRMQAKLEADQARQEAEKEIERLRKEAEMARLQAEEQASKKQAAALAAKQAESEAAIQKAIEQARQETQAEIERLRQQAEKAQDAEQARKWAEQEITRVKEQAEQERLRMEEQAIRIAEAARAEAVEEAYKITAAKESEIVAVAKQSAEQAKRALEAEEARRRAEEEIERLKQESETARQQMQQQLSSEIERSEIEHEVARARALELANKQAEIEEVTKKAEQEARRAMLAETERKKTDDEINNIKREMEALRQQQESFAKQQSSGVLSAGDQELARNSAKALADKQEEIAQISLKAAEQIAKANAADEARKQAEVEIQRLRSEVGAATLQAQAQLQADAERAAAEQQALQERTAELEKMQAMIAEAEHRAQQEAARAQQAEKARRQAQEQFARLKAAEEANERAQEEIQRLKAEAGMAYYQAQEQAKLTAEQIRQKAELEIQQARAEEAARKKSELAQAARLARQEAERAEQAESARKLAEAEIKKLKAEAKLQHIKAEKAIRETIKSAREEEFKKIQQRATDKARRTVKTDPRKPNVTSNKNKSSQPQVNQEDDPLEILDLAQTTNAARNAGQKSYDFSKETASQGGGGFISDQIMWETALGIREDQVVAEQPEPKNEPAAPQARQSGVAPQISNMPTAYPDAQRDQPVFRAKDVNPYVNTQDVTSIVRKHKRSGGVFKYVMILLSLCIGAGAVYYFTLNNSQREQQREQIKSFIEKEIPTSKPAQTNADTSSNMAAGGDVSEPVIPAPSAREQRALTMQERMELKREKAIEDIIQRKKALELKVEKQPDSNVLPETSEPSMAPQNAPQGQNSLPALVDIAPAAPPESMDSENIPVEEIAAPPATDTQLLPLNNVPSNDAPINGARNSGSDPVVQVNEAISVVVSDPVSGESAR